jgi:hypothetical protein
LFLMTKHTPNIEFSRLKNPINMETAINSMIPGRTASHTESLKFLYGSDSTSIIIRLRKLTAIKLGHGIVQLNGLILSSDFLQVFVKDRREILDVNSGYLLHT